MESPVVNTHCFLNEKLFSVSFGLIQMVSRYINDAQSRLLCGLTISGNNFCIILYTFGHSSTLR